MSLQDPSPEAAGYAYAVPLAVEIPITIDAFRIEPSPWGSPMAYALSGTNPDTGASSLVFAYEYPWAWMRLDKSMSKAELELVHVGRLRTHYLPATGTNLIFNIREGSDPPDLLATTADGETGIECTRLAIDQRLHAYALLKHIRQHFGRHTPESFSKLAGAVTYLWSRDTDDLLTRPFARSDEKAIDELVKSFASHELDLAAIGATHLGETMPPLPVSSTDSGATFYAVPFISAAPEGRFSVNSDSSSALHSQPRTTPRPSGQILKHVSTKRTRQVLIGS